MRLAPNTAVAHSAATARTMPGRAVPTGWLPRPRPRCRIPIRTVAGSSAAAAARLTAMATGAGGRGGRVPAPGVTHRLPDRQRGPGGHQCHPASGKAHGSRDIRARDAAAIRASPTGVSGDARTARQDGVDGPRRADRAARIRAAARWRGRTPTAGGP